ncbi:MAG: RNA polymerase sigma factor [Chloroflexi bacterium]|nr:RNA polymerase sigma factor [Chloroflexota bacterium]
MVAVTNEADTYVGRAKMGDSAAVEALVRAIQDRIYGLAMRMLADPADAQDATQEILMKVVANLASYRGESAFATWVYRVAANHLLSARKHRAEERAEQMGLTFDTLEQMLQQGLAFSAVSAAPQPPPAEERVLEEEVKIGCTQSMLLFLDREHRLAFILGEVLDLTGEEGAAILGVTPPAFRKRLSRARARLCAFMSRQCGLVNHERPCRCAVQIPFAVHAGIVDPARPRFATHPVRMRHGAGPAGPDEARPPERSDQAIARMRELETLEKITAVFRSHPDYAAPDVFAGAIKGLVDSGKFGVLSE